MDGGVGTDFMRFLLMRCSCPKWSLRAVKDWPPDLWASRSRWFSARSESLSFFRLPISWRTSNEERTRQDMAIRTGIRRVKKVRPGVADAIVHEVIFKRNMIITMSTMCIVAPTALKTSSWSRAF